MPRHNFMSISVSERMKVDKIPKFWCFMTEVKVLFSICVCMSLQAETTNTDSALFSGHVEMVVRHPIQVKNHLSTGTVELQA
jgi:hypothetical protein